MPFFDPRLTVPVAVLERIARSRLDVDVALGEIVHFLTHDERLPGRTRKAVQFLHGLREQMVQTDTQKSNPELFDCPFTAASVEQYTFKEVRQRYGESFSDKFWPVFQVSVPKNHPAARHGRVLPRNGGCSSLSVRPRDGVCVRRVTRVALLARWPAC